MPGALPGFVAGLLVLVGLTFIFAGVRARRTSRQFLSVARQAQGTVTDLRFRKRTGVQSSGAWFPVLRFTTADGRDVDTESIFGQMPAPGRKGDLVTILYDPSDPRRSALEGHASSATGGVVVVVLGCLSILLGLGIGAVSLVVSNRL